MNTAKSRHPAQTKTQQRVYRAMSIKRGCVKKKTENREPGTAEPQAALRKAEEESKSKEDFTSH